MEVPSENYPNIIIMKYNSLLHYHFTIIHRIFLNNLFVSQKEVYVTVHRDQEQISISISWVQSDTRQDHYDEIILVNNDKTYIKQLFDLKCKYTRIIDDSATFGEAPLLDLLI